MNGVLYWKRLYIYQLNWDGVNGRGLISFSIPMMLSVKADSYLSSSDFQWMLGGRAIRAVYNQMLKLGWPCDYFSALLYTMHRDALNITMTTRVKSTFDFYYQRTTGTTA